MESKRTVPKQHQNVLSSSIDEKMSPKKSLKKQKIKIEKTWYEKARDFTFGTILLKHSGKENILGWIFRQFLFTDSSGQPSITVTSYWLIMGLIVFVTAKETSIATSFIDKIDPETGKVIGREMKGYSEYFYYLLFVLASIITGIFAGREKNRKGSTTWLDTVKEKAMSIFTKK